MEDMFTMQILGSCLGIVVLFTVCWLHLAEYCNWCNAD